MAKIPGVVTVGAIDNLMLNALNQQGKLIHVPGVTPPKGQTAFDVDYTSADSGLFGAIGLTLVRGRGITAADVPGAPRVAVINEAMANRFWPGQEAVGRTFNTDSVTYQIVGVMHTTKVRTPRRRAAAILLHVVRAGILRRPSMLIARTNGDADRTATQMLATLREIDPSLMAIQVKTMSRHLAAMLLPARLGAMAFMLFAALALALAVLGVYGVVELRGGAPVARSRHSPRRRRAAERDRAIAHARRDGARGDRFRARTVVRSRRGAGAADAPVRSRARRTRSRSSRRRSCCLSWAP